VYRKVGEEITTPITKDRKQISRVMMIKKNMIERDENKPELRQRKKKKKKEENQNRIGLSRVCSIT
jgi:hypothetical protein